jgi:hypothetical protein
MLKEHFKEFSPRTLAIYMKAFDQLMAVQALTGGDDLAECIAECSRINGSINVAKFARLAKDRAAMAAARAQTGR